MMVYNANVETKCLNVYFAKGECINGFREEEG